MMAVSASRARFCNQFFFLVCKLYLRPFCSKAVSLLEKEMFILFITLGWNVCFSCGVAVCVCVNFLRLFKLLYLLPCFFLEFLFDCVLDV